MTQEEIITRLIDHLDLYLTGGFGSVHQDPYKSDIFKLFMEAYNNGYCEHPSSPLLTGDALRDTLQVFWDTGGEETQRQKVANEVLTMWDEWRYACDHRP